MTLRVWEKLYISSEVLKNVKSKIIQQNDISDRIGLKDETKKVLSAIKTLGEKCQEILMLASEGMRMQEMKEITGVRSLGTVLSRLSNCRKELKGLVA